MKNTKITLLNIFVLVASLVNVYILLMMAGGGNWAAALVVAYAWVPLIVWTIIAIVFTQTSLRFVSGFFSSVGVLVFLLLMFYYLL